VSKADSTFETLDTRCSRKGISDQWSPSKLLALAANTAGSKPKANLCFLNASGTSSIIVVNYVIWWPLPPQHWSEPVPIRLVQQHFRSWPMNLIISKFPHFGSGRGREYDLSPVVWAWTGSWVFNRSWKLLARQDSGFYEVWIFFFGEKTVSIKSARVRRASRYKARAFSIFVFNAMSRMRKRGLLAIPLPRPRARVPREINQGILWVLVLNIIRKMESYSKNSFLAEVYGEKASAINMGHKFRNSIIDSRTYRFFAFSIQSSKKTPEISVLLNAWAWIVGLWIP